MYTKIGALWHSRISSNSCRYFFSDPALFIVYSTALGYFLRHFLMTTYCHIIGPLGHGLFDPAFNYREREDLNAPTHQPVA